jgi:hypothetical protein
MKRFRAQLASLLTWGMIPLALGASLPGKACQCANGNVKLFCAGPFQFAPHTRSVAEPRSCANHRACGATHVIDCCHAAEGAIGNCCEQASQHPSQPCGKCCKAISRAPANLVELVAPPDNHDSFQYLLAIEPNFLGQFVPLYSAHQVERIDTGPPVDLVVVHHCFLI